MRFCIFSSSSYLVKDRVVIFIACPFFLNLIFMKANPINKEIEQYLLTAWKTKTMTQMVAEKNLDFSAVSIWFKKHNIYPITQRDLITKEIILMHQAGIPLKCKPVAQKLKCSQALVRDIIVELGYDKDSPIKCGPATDSTVLRHDQSAYLLKQYEQQTKARRAQYAIYTQSGSQILDALRNINTTKREKTLASNGRV